MYSHTRSWECIVSIMTRLEAGHCRIPILLGGRGLDLLQNVETSSGANSCYYSMGTGRSCPGGGVKQPGCETDHLPAFSAEVENECSYTFTPPVCFRCMYGVSFTFTFC
jgi:hypothetical protein